MRGKACCKMRAQRDYSKRCCILAIIPQGVVSVRHAAARCLRNEINALLAQCHALIIQILSAGVFSRFFSFLFSFWRLLSLLHFFFPPIFLFLFSF